MESEIRQYHTLSKKDKLQLLKEIKDHTITYREQLDLPKDTTFGVELEFLLKHFYYNDEDRVFIYNTWFQELFHNKESKYHTEGIAINKDWLLSLDYEVDGEFTSPILRDQKSNWEDLKKICEMLKEKGAYGGDYASTQINIGAQIFRKDYKRFQNAITNYALFEDVFYYATKGEQQKYRLEIINYANPIASKILNAKTNISKYTYRNFINEATYACAFGDKMSSLNLVKLRVYKGFDEDNLLEVRMPNATFRIQTLQTWISLFTHFFDRAGENVYFYEKYAPIMKKLNYLPLETKEYNLCNYEKALELADIAFEKEIDKLNFLKQYIRYHDYEKIEKELILK